MPLHQSLRPSQDMEARRRAKLRRLDNIGLRALIMSWRVHNLWYASLKLELPDFSADLIKSVPAIRYQAVGSTQPPSRNTSATPSGDFGFPEVASYENEDSFDISQFNTIDRSLSNNNEISPFMLQSMPTFFSPNAYAFTAPPTEFHYLDERSQYNPHAVMPPENPSIEPFSFPIRSNAPTSSVPPATAELLHSQQTAELLSSLHRVQLRNTCTTSDATLLLARQGFALVEKLLFNTDHHPVYSTTFLLASVQILHQVVICYASLLAQSSRFNQHSSSDDTFQIDDFHIEGAEIYQGVIQAIVSRELKRCEDMLAKLEGYQKTAVVAGRDETGVLAMFLGSLRISLRETFQTISHI